MGQKGWKGGVVSQISCELFSNGFEDYIVIISGSIFYGIMYIYVYYDFYYLCLVWIRCSTNICEKPRVCI